MARRNYLERFTENSVPEVIMKKTIVMLINSLEGGGAERVVSRLASDLSKEYSVVVVLLDSKPQKYRFVGDVDIVEISCSNFLLASIKFGKLIKSLDSKIVISFLSRSNFVNVISKVISPHYAVISERTTPSKHFLDNNIYNLVSKLLLFILYRFSNKIISVSDGVKDDLVKNFSINESLIQTICNPFPVANIEALGRLNIPYSNFICSVGRLTEVKQFDCLIRAYKLSNIKAMLLIVGDGDKRNDLAKLVDDLQIPDKVKFVGFQENPYKFIANSRFFVLSSKREGFPNALVESMALGKAVISTDCASGPREILAPEYKGEIYAPFEGDYGLLVPVTDVQQMANAIKIMEDNPTLRIRYERDGYRRSLDFQSDIIIKQHFSYIEQVV